MKRLLIPLLCTLLLAGCANPVTGDEFVSTVTIGGVEITGDTADSQPHTGTELTALAERLLKEKYGEDFRAAQTVYYDEFSLIVDITAHPVSDPELEFRVNIPYGETPEIRSDTYYTRLHEDEESEIFFSAISGMELPIEKLTVSDYIEPGTEISQDMFRGREIAVYIYLPDGDSAQQVIDERVEICRRVRDRLSPLSCNFFLKTGSGDDHSAYTDYSSFMMCRNYQAEDGWYETAVVCWIDDEFTALPVPVI
ncbi:MAG: hypothetical protein IJ874_01720 [Ruminococcus sp.]|nr:hypothetical protein [Ruminococcus sp.]